MRRKGGPELWKSLSGAWEQTKALVAVVVRALEPWFIQETIPKSHAVKDVCFEER